MSEEAPTFYEVVATLVVEEPHGGRLVRVYPGCHPQGVYVTNPELRSGPFEDRVTAELAAIELLHKHDVCKVELQEIQDVSR